MAPVKSATLRPAKKFLTRESTRDEMIDDDVLSIRSMDTRDSRISARSFDSLPRAITPPCKMEGVEEGMRCCVAGQYRDRRGLYGYRTEVPNEEKEEEPDNILEPDEEWLKQFAIVARKRIIPNGRGRSSVDSIRIRSPLLKRVLRDLCKDYPGFSGHKGNSVLTMDMYDPFDALFHYWDDLLRLEEEHANPEARDHIKLLRDLFEPEFKGSKEKLEECRATGNITFSALWTIFKPGELIYRKDVNGRECVERIDDMFYGFNNDCRAFKVESKMVAWDGKRFGYGLSSGWFYVFPGQMNVMDLPAVPLEIHPDRLAIKARMMKRGEKFQQLAGCHLKAYTGPEGEAAYRPTRSNKASPERLQIYDRIIINPDGLGCPRMTVDLDPLIKENPFDNLPSDRISSPGSLRRSAATDLRKAREEWDSKTKTPSPKPRRMIQGVPSLTDDDAMICAPEIACFDLTRKEWAIVDLAEIGDVAWNEDAFDDLVWPTEEKEMLLAVTKSYFSSLGGAGIFTDIVDKKARGTKILLASPSGCGKACAVEAVAEKLHMPVYAISAGEMVIRFEEFEDRLEDALERCRKWNAVLLLRNVDFFFGKTLEGTNRADIFAIVMHHLESHPGLVFMTAESLEPLDPLLMANVDLTLKIPSPTREMRRSLWANALSAALPLRERKFSSENLDELAGKVVTGREIKSAVKMAGMLAANKGCNLRMEHIRSVLKLKGV